MEPCTNLLIGYKLACGIQVKKKVHNTHDRYSNEIANTRDCTKERNKRQKSFYQNKLDFFYVTVALDKLVSYIRIL